MAVAAGDGRIDVVFDLTPEEAKAFSSDKGRIQTKKAKTIVAGVFNENKPNSPWTNVEVRKALNMAIDRQAILDVGAYGYGTVIPAFIQPDRYGFDAGLQPIALDAAKAARVIEQHGLKGREIVIVASPTYARVVDELGKAFAAIDLTVRAQITKDPPQEGWDIKLEWYFDWSPQFPVGVVHREFFGKTGILRQAPEDPGFDALYEKLLRTVMQPAQEEVVKEVERYVHDQAKCLFLYSPFTLFAVSNRVDFMPYDTCMSELAETTIKA
jgi:peptide/nickel transport system substrate-binding protein